MTKENKIKVTEDDLLIGKEGEYTLYFNKGANKITLANKEQSYSVGLKKLGDGVFEDK